MNNFDNVTEWNADPSELGSKRHSPEVHHPGHHRGPGMNCIKIGLPGKLILSKRKALCEVLFS